MASASLVGRNDLNHLRKDFFGVLDILIQVLAMIISMLTVACDGCQQS